MSQKGNGMFNKEELNLLRQWYNAVDDLSCELSVVDEDEILYQKIIFLLSESEK